MFKIRQLPTLFLRLPAVWLGFALPLMLLAPAFGVGEGVSRPASGMSGGQAFIVVNSLYAVAAYWIAWRSRLTRKARFIMLFVLVFGVQTVMTHSETLFFAAAFDLESLNLPALVALNAITAVVASLVTTMVFPASGGQPLRRTLFAGARAGKFPTRFAAVALLYVATYFTAGNLLFWASPAVRDFYAGASASSSMLVLLQLVRGCGWACLLWLVLSCLRGTTFERIVAAAVVVTLLFGAQLLFPNAEMPTPVRYGHLIEIALSMLVWGLLSGFLLTSSQFRKGSGIVRDGLNR